MKIAIFGAGLIGKKRGLQLQGQTLVGLYDPDRDRARVLAAERNTEAYDSEAALLERSGTEIVIVATTNASLARVAERSITAGKHVLVEKPAAITLSEIDRLAALAREKRVAVKVGFNHRFHPALLETRRLADQGKLGPLMFMRLRYGHGARLWGTSPNGEPGRK